MMRAIRAALAAICTLAALMPSGASSQDTIRLEWTYQGQFAGEIVALDRGYYKAAGADVKLLTAGNDIKPAIMVAQGSDTFGIGSPNQVIMARSFGAPLVMVTQYGQKSGQVYMARKDAGIRTLADVRGKNVGSWFGGDEAEFLAMLHTVNLKASDLHLIPQPGNGTPMLLSKQLDVIEAAVYAPGDYAPLFKALGRNNITFIRPETYHTAIINTGLFTTEKTIAQRPQLVQAVVDATLRGWQEALRDPAAAARIIKKYDPETIVADQTSETIAMGEMFCAGPTLQGRFGESTPEAWATVQRILLSYGNDNPDGLHQPIDLSKAYTNAFWAKAPAAYKTIPCKHEAGT
jgi:NitT/TauT family transport system substrate-binding protein